MDGFRSNYGLSSFNLMAAAAAAAAGDDVLNIHGIVVRRSHRIIIPIVFSHRWVGGDYDDPAGYCSMLQ